MTEHSLNYAWIIRFIVDAVPILMELSTRCCRSFMELTLSDEDYVEPRSRSLLLLKIDLLFLTSTADVRFVLSYISILISLHI